MRGGWVGLYGQRKVISVQVCDKGNESSEYGKERNRKRRPAALDTISGSASLYIETVTGPSRDQSRMTNGR